jgi:hypothetical protein
MAGIPAAPCDGGCAPCGSGAVQAAQAFADAGARAKLHTQASATPETATKVKPCKTSRTLTPAHPAKKSRSFPGPWTPH